MFSSGSSFSFIAATLLFSSSTTLALPAPGGWGEWNNPSPTTTTTTTSSSSSTTSSSPTSTSAISTVPSTSGSTSTSHSTSSTTSHITSSTTIQTTSSISSHATTSASSTSSLSSSSSHSTISSHSTSVTTTTSATQTSTTSKPTTSHSASKLATSTTSSGGGAGISIGVGISPTITLPGITIAPTVGATVVITATGPLGTLLSDLTSEVGCIASNFIEDFELVVATLVPDALTAATNTLEAILTAGPTPTNYIEFAAELVQAGLTSDNVETAVEFVTGILEGEASEANINLRQPSLPIYPYAGYADAPYDIPEAILRAAIYIPPTFKYGKGLQPIILVPGTGDIGYTTFKGNLIPLLQGSTIADPVWLNIPGFLLNDAQGNAEFVAYAINYIFSISGQKPIAVAGWSQGNINTQWALKYWPSTRDRVTDHIAFSPDYHGTILANFLATPCGFLPPSILQQEYNSNFITTLRAYNGDSAYVPTTTIYSGLLDEIVEPQQGTGASAYLLDARHVGVTNNEVQSICGPDQPAGSFYTHEGTLYNPIGFELLKDALAHAGPGQVSRINLDVCGDYLTPGLDLADFLETENSILIAAVALLTYPSTSNVEPPIKPYATNALAQAGY